MPHITAEQLYAHVFDNVALDAEAAIHLNVCGECQREQEYLVQFAQDLTVMGASQPSAAAIARYNRLFDAVQPRKAAAGSLWQTIVATLRWDSRQQPALQGVRRAIGGAAGYRLLYVCAGAEIELMVEPEQNRYRIQGEFLIENETESSGTTLIQLVDASGASICDHELVEGTFHCSDITPGVYRLLVSPPTGARIAVEPLEIG